MARNFTNRGTKWEWINSWWILFTFGPFGVMSFFSFLYVGSKVKYKKWIWFGFVYLGVFTIAFVTPDSGIGALIATSNWVISIIHAFRIRPSFLIQLDVMKEKQPIIRQEKISKLRQEAAERFERAMQEEMVSSEVSQQEGAGNSTEQILNTSTLNLKPALKESSLTEKASKIDINSATEAEIASIPAIGLILAKKVVLKRQELGGFDSFEQFAQIIGLNEHKAMKIKPLVEISKREKTTAQQSSGRLIDF